MTEFEKPPLSEPVPEPAHQVPPAPYPPRQVSDKAWLGITSLSVSATGILGAILASIIPGIWAFLIAPLVLFPLAIAGVIFGHLGLKDAKTKNTPRGVSVAGLVGGYVLIGVCILMLVIVGLGVLLIANWSTGA